MWPFTKDEPKAEKPKTKMLGKAVRYSYETAVENPYMILNEFDRIISDKKTRIVGTDFARIVKTGDEEIVVKDEDGVMRVTNGYNIEIDTGRWFGWDELTLVMMYNIIARNYEEYREIVAIEKERNEFRNLYCDPRKRAKMKMELAGY